MKATMRRSRLLVAMLVIVVVGVIPAAPALAACNTYAQGATWQGNCWVGYGYDTAADYITGVQRILKGLGFYGGTIDGLWGALSKGATQNYQSSQGLSADGIVGTNTWTELRTELTSCGLIGSYYYHKRPGESCNGSFRMLDNGTNFPWYIKKLNNTWSTSFGLSGPA